MANEQNLKPFTGADDPRRHNGRPKGRRNLSTIVRDILEDEIDWTLVPIKNATELSERYKDKRAWEAMVYVAFAQAMTGNMKAADWLSKAGYGNKLEVSGGADPIKFLLDKFGVMEGGDDEQDDESVQSSSSSSP